VATGAGKVELAGAAVEGLLAVLEGLQGGLAFHLDVHLHAVGQGAQ
jgi:hypothetical protein